MRYYVSFCIIILYREGEDMSRMLKRVLMFHGTDVCNNTLNLFSDFVAKKLISKGVDVVYIDLFQDGEKLTESYMDVIRKGVDAAIAFNAAGQQSTVINGVNIYEYMEIPFFNWIVDHPCEHVVDLESDVSRYHVICIDRDHVDFIKKYFYNIQDAHFIPLGGYEAGIEELTEEDFFDREFDIIYTAGNYPLELQIKKIKDLLPDNLQKVSFDMIDYMLDNRSANNEESLRYALRANGFYVDDSEFKDYAYMTSMTNIFVRTYVRQELVANIAASGLPMHIFGDGWDLLEDKGNLILHGSVSYVESAELCKKARLSLNVMPWFKNGIHDRIPTAMLAGSAVITDPTDYIRESFATDGDGRQLYLYEIDKPQLAPDLIRYALKNPVQLFATAQRGFKKAREELTWDCQVDKLIDIITQSIN